MRKKIQESLSAKVFLVTMLLLSGMGLLAYGLLAVLMPQTYSNTLNENLDRLAKEFISELEKAAYQDSGGLFAQFLQMDEIRSAELYAENGEQVPVPVGPAEMEGQLAPALEEAGLGEAPVSPSGQASFSSGQESAFAQEDAATYAGEVSREQQDAAAYAGEVSREQQDAAAYAGEVSREQQDAAAYAGEEGRVQQDATAYAEEDGEGSPILSNSYYFSFQGEKARYMLKVYGEAGELAELKAAFLRVLPVLACAVLGASFLASWLYSYIITKPVLKISRISQEMSELKLDWQLGSPRPDELGKLEGSLHFLSQKLAAAISDLQSANEKLTEDIAHEKALEQARLDFFSAVSHELKTPITIIKGQLEGMLLGVGVYKDHGKYLARALEVANMLERMVQELLTVSRMETSQGSGDRAERFDCVKLVQGYLGSQEDLAAKKGLEVHCSLPEEVFISGNQLLMEKVFSNLIGNAVKYTPQGGEIFLSACEKQGKYEFSVENTGAHIPEESFPKLFDAFYRVEQSRNRSTGGSGLGLYIVQKILGQHGSVCTVENTEKGVRFSFLL